MLEEIVREYEKVKEKTKSTEMKTIERVMFDIVDNYVDFNNVDIVLNYHRSSMQITFWKNGEETEEKLSYIFDILPSEYLEVFKYISGYFHVEFHVDENITNKKEFLNKFKEYFKDDKDFKDKYKKHISKYIKKYFGKDN